MPIYALNLGPSDLRRFSQRRFGVISPMHWWDFVVRFCRRRMKPRKHTKLHETKTNFMSVTLNEDKVWFDEARKLEHICADISVVRSDGRRVLVLSHFESTLTSLTSALREQGIHHERFSSLNPAELCMSAPGKVWFASASAFQVANEMTAIVHGSRLEIIVAEHHPMHSRDQQIVDAAGKLSCDAQLCFYFSLDDPVMQHFGNERIKALFERLGIDKNECISHHLINTAIRTAQEKIEKQVGKDVPTHSAADWFKYNLRDKKNN
jgi:preprotein translocase subunit SecA